MRQQVTGENTGAGCAAPDFTDALTMLGFESFRPGQREAVETLLEERRLLLVAPTGGGKSLIYQLPAVILCGTTLVISPLVSLMNDQVASLTARGVPATYLASTLDAAEQRRRLDAMAGGEYRLVYLAPERLALPGFRSLLDRIDCPLIAVDEAHCISEWGHDFRPEYMQIGALIAQMAGARVLACTATATPVVRDEIVARLGLDPDTRQIVRGFARPNLSLRVREVNSGRQRHELVDALLAEALAPGAGTAIVYAPTRRATEEEAARLAADGWSTRAYHAGLPGPVRESVQQEFDAGSCQVVVATNAFGMGIDRPDVRAVVHLAPPGSIEAYYQEVGRAGRDGGDSFCLLLTAAGDMPLRRRLIERGSGDGKPPAAEAIQHKWNLFLELMRWAEGGSCRHDAILRYFGDEEETLAGCGRCDVCTEMALGAGDDPEAVSLIVRKALSAVARVNGRFGIQVAANLLRGNEGDERLGWSGLAATPTFGSLAGRSQDWLLKLLRRCVTAGWVDFTGGSRPLVVLTGEGRAVMRGDAPARLVLPPVNEPRKGRTGSAGRLGAGLDGNGTAGRALSAGDAGLDDGARALFEALRRHRLELARAESLPPYVIASDRTLREIARQRPRSVEELLLVHGIGRSRAERYGAGLLAVVSSLARP
ncbi:MAG: ATP-dependent DNA helicase [Actinobacteria bacterium]|nr:ATP-dependent DNA helicase [Actinomycetota bacterium]MCL6093177.1 ATP-dependent DNA helicase [Actinomycetota bacterium]